MTSDGKPERRDAEGGVLHVITGLDVGGAEGQLTELALRSHASGRAVMVASLLPDGGNRGRLAAAGVPVIDLGMTRRRPSASALSRLAAVIRRLRPAVVQSWLYHADLIATAALFLSGRWFATRLLWGVRCSDMDPSHYPRGLRLIIRAGAMLSRLPEAVVVNSEAGRAVHERLGYRPHAFHVIDNGVDCARFRPDAEARAAVRRELGLDDKAPLLAHVARLDPMKDHRCFLAALDRLGDVHALAIGAGTEALPARRGLHRLGRRDDMPRWLAACDVIVSSSAFGEGVSNAVAEGMAAGLAPVVTDVGDSARLVGASGEVAPPGEPAALAAAIERVLADDPAARGRAARQRIIERFSIERMVAAYHALHRL